VEKINEEQKLRFFQKIRSALWTFRAKKVGVLGLAFKGGTDDVRESPALDVVKRLLDEGCVITAYDPAAEARAKEFLPESEQMRYASDPYAAAQDADALLILNDWQEFAELDLAKLHYTLRYPIVIDGRNLYDQARMIQNGFTYLSVGRPGLSHSADTVGAFRGPQGKTGNAS